MYKGIRLIKRVVALFLVLLLSIESFGAVVSDNDGSAFITKAEFDSLKNNFQSQIVQYNTSIDSKIDGAIASYLAGMEIKAESLDNWTKVLNATGQKFRFVNHIPGYGVQTITTDTSVSTYNHISRYLDVVYAQVASRGSGAGFDYMIVPTQNGIWDSHICGTTVEGNGNSKTWRTITKWTKEIPANKANLTQRRDNFADIKSSNTDGSGSAWIYRINPDGTQSLDTYNPILFPMQDITVHRFRYKSFTTKTETGNNTNFNYYWQNASSMNMTGSKTQTIPAMYAWGRSSGGTSVNPQTSTSADTTWYEHKVMKIQSSDGGEYSLFQWGGSTSGAKIWALADNQGLNTQSAKTISATNSTKTELYFPLTGVQTRDITFSGIAVTYTPVVLRPAQRALSSFKNNYLSNIAGETVYIGNGAPLFETASTDQTIKVKLHAFLTNSSGVRQTGGINVMISDKKFVSGGFDSTAKLKIVKTFTIGNAAGADIEIDVECEKKQLYWINAYPSSSGYFLGFENPSFKLKN